MRHSKNLKWCNTYRRLRGKVDLVGKGTGLGKRKVLLLLEVSVVILASVLVQLIDFLDVLLSTNLVLIEQSTDNTNSARGIGNMNGRLAVFWGNLDGSVNARRGGSTNQQWQVHATTFHLLSNVDHLIERGSNETRQTNDIDVLRDSGVENLLAGDHNTHVDDTVVVATKNDTNNVLSDIMDVALNGSEKDGPGVLRLL
jgi:hypothetical protein